jgi:hypothetical protein
MASRLPYGATGVDSTNYTFSIIILKMNFFLKNGYKTYKMTVELVSEGASFERFKINAKNNSGKFLILQNNWPLIRGKNLKHKRLNWKVVKGEITNRTALDEDIKILEFCRALAVCKG